jgi:hypothetical protein
MTSTGAFSGKNLAPLGGLLHGFHTYENLPPSIARFHAFDRHGACAWWLPYH